jgi:RNA-directed DNA polymerase
MDVKTCAASDRAGQWESVDWNSADRYVKNLQMRIVKAWQEGKYSKVKSLQHLLTTSEKRQEKTFEYLDHDRQSHADVI